MIAQPLTPALLTAAGTDLAAELASEVVARHLQAAAAAGAGVVVGVGAVAGAAVVGADGVAVGVILAGAGVGAVGASALVGDGAGIGDSGAPVGAWAGPRSGLGRRMRTAPGDRGGMSIPDMSTTIPTDPNAA